MTNSNQHAKRPRITILEIFLLLVLLLISFRSLAIAALIIAAIIYTLYPFHDRRHWLIIACITYAALHLP